MSPTVALNLVIRPTLSLMGLKYQSVAAERQLLAIALQESKLEHRVQVRGPAHGYWQFESGGGVKSVLAHKASSQLAKALCEELDYEPTQAVVYEAIVNDAILACIFARLLLFTDPKPLPTTQQAGWDYYKRNWRPGKPHPATWPGHWKTAEETLNGQ